MYINSLYTEVVNSPINPYIELIHRKIAFINRSFPCIRNFLQNIAIRYMNAGQFLFPAPPPLCVCVVKFTILLIPLSPPHLDTRTPYVCGGEIIMKYGMQKILPFCIQPNSFSPFHRNTHEA